MQETGYDDPYSVPFIYQIDAFALVVFHDYLLRKRKRFQINGLYASFFIKYKSRENITIAYKVLKHLAITYITIGFSVICKQN